MDTEYWLSAARSSGKFLTINRVRTMVGTARYSAREVQEALDALTEAGYLTRTPIYVAFEGQDWSEAGEYWTLKS